MPTLQRGVSLAEKSEPFLAMLSSTFQSSNTPRLQVASCTLFQQLISKPKFSNGFVCLGRCPPPFALAFTTAPRRISQAGAARLSQKIGRQCAASCDSFAAQQQLTPHMQMRGEHLKRHLAHLRIAFEAAEKETFKTQRVLYRTASLRARSILQNLRFQ